MISVLTALKTHPTAVGLISSLGSLWLSFLEVLPAYLRLINLALAMAIGIISLALKLREWRNKQRNRATESPNETD